MARRRRQPAKAQDQRRAAMVARVAEILDDADAPSRFCHEAACRTGLRSVFCLAGAKWDQADTLAAEIVAAALRTIGAQRPTWQQGQPEWAQDGHVPIERTRCVRCGDHLEGEQTLYCSELCCSAAHHARARIMGEQQSRNEWRARVAAETEHRRLQRERDCDQCGKPFIYPTFQPNQRFCSRACADAAHGTLPGERACQTCGRAFVPAARGRVGHAMRFCSHQCSNIATAEARKANRVKLCASCGTSFPTDVAPSQAPKNCPACRRPRSARLQGASELMAEQSDQDSEPPPIMLAAE